MRTNRDLVKSLFTLPFDFKQWERMVVLPHIHPDGDTIGSSIALYHFLTTLGLETIIVNNDTIPVSLRFLTSEGIVSSEAFEALGWEAGSYAVIVVDGSDLTRVNDRIEIYEKASFSLCIDHHITNEKFADLTWIEPTASSTGELVYELIMANGVEVTSTIARALYVAISTDTGSFKYDNTSANTLRVVADLIDTGFDVQEVIVEVYQNKDVDQVRLLQIALNHLTLHQGGKIGISYIEMRDVLSAQIENYDTDGICESIRDISGLEVAVFLREIKPQIFKVSSRSKHNFDVAKFSMNFGGGGHKKAAGFTMEMSLEEALEAILDCLKSKVSE
jgi:phosphoesterase RecJ-like protein